MKKLFIFLTLIVALSTVNFGQSATEKALAKIEQDIATAILKSDFAVLEKHFADNGALTDPTGAVMTKAESITFFKSGQLKFEKMQLDEIKVRIFGNTAIVTYRSTEKGKYKEQVLDGQTRWTDTFMKIKGKWIIIASHGSPVTSQY